MERKNNQRTEDGYDLKQLIIVLLEKIWIIILSAAGLGLAAFIFSRFMMDPVYQSATKIYVLNREAAGTTTYSDLETSTQLTKDYQIMIESRPVLERVIRNLDLDYNTEQLKGMITVYALTDTRILEIAVSNADPHLAKLIADKVAEVSSARISEVMDIDEVNVVEEGNLPEKPVSPNIKINSVIGGMLGVMISCFILVMIYMFDDTIKSENDVEKYLGLGILGLIPLSETDDKHGRKKKKDKKNKKRGL